MTVGKDPSDPTGKTEMIFERELNPQSPKGFKEEEEDQEEDFMPSKEVHEKKERTDSTIYTFDVKRDGSYVSTPIQFFISYSFFPSARRPKNQRTNF